MPPEHATLVVDTNIFIDISCGSLEFELFRLLCRISTTDMVFEEIQEPDPQKLIGYGLEVRSLSGDQIQRIRVLAARYPRPSRPDLSALVLASQLKTMLLTGDRNLRKAARDLGVSVHGTLWVLQELINHNIIAPQKAARALREMPANGRRLPPTESNKLIKRWEGLREASPP